MRRSASLSLFLAMTTIAAGLVSGHAPGRAADMPPPTPPAPPVVVSTGWEFSVSLNGWLSGVKGDMATLPPLPRVHVDLGFDQVLDHLDGAFMGSAEARNGRFVLFADIVFAKIGTSAYPRGPLFDRASVTSTSFIGTLAAGYRVVDTPTFSLDALAGVRAYSVKTKIRTTSLVPALNLAGQDTEIWADPMIGAAARLQLTDSLYLTSIGFIGGFDAASELSWDVFGGIGYRFNPQVSAVIGYRALGVDYARNGFLYDVVQKGPMTVLTVRF